jgi:hypothetical protein
MLNGACMCGRIQYQIARKPRFMYRCYCAKCRAASGAAFVTNIIVDADSFSISAGKGFLGAFESSPGKFRHFCRECGSPIYSRGEQTKHVVSVRCGTLKDDPGVRLAYHAFVAAKAPWVEIHDDRPQFAEWADPVLVKQLFKEST